MGDPAGVGPELCLRLLANAELAESCTPIVFGDVALLQHVADHVGLPFTAEVISPEHWATACEQVDRPAVLNLGHVNANTVEPGMLSADCGEAAYQYVIASIDAALAGQVEGVSTGPLNKEALHAAGRKFPGHTEIFGERMNAERWCMMQYSDEITCSFVTVHVGYTEAPALLSIERIVDVMELTIEALQRIQNRTPKLVVCGLNPHAGENGLFGNREEERFILPAIERIRATGVEVDGPLPPDTAFLPQRRLTTDAFICMYHDQGHIPLKVLAFDTAINTTLGLPVTRTSVDHGTAFDIAWQGIASPNSLFAAVKLAAQLSPRRVNTR